MIYFTPLFALIGGLIFRMRGGMPPSFPRPVEQLLFSLPYGAAAYLATENYYITAITLAFTTIAVLKGHGHNMDLGSYKGEADYEWYEFVIKPLHGRIPEYWYDVVGIAISGLTYTIPAGIACMNPLLALSGALKAPAYMIGWSKDPWPLPEQLKEPTQIGEFLTGFFLWGVLWLTLL